jgi:hypothetical protein
MDPLRPFATLLRSLWTGAKSQRTGHAQASSAGRATVADAEPLAPVPSIAARLQPRLAALKEWQGGRARELFIEHVLIEQFGERLAGDPKFAELVQRVSLDLAEEPALDARLDELLQALATKNST